MATPASWDEDAAAAKHFSGPSTSPHRGDGIEMGRYRSPRQSIGSVLQKRYDEALAALPTYDANCENAWIGHHIRGMILLRQGDFTSALDHFKAGSSAAPFISQRRHFARALVVAQLRVQNYSEALKIMNDQVRDPSAEVIQLHAFAALNRDLAHSSC